MDKNKIIYKTPSSYFGHMFTTVLILVTIFGYNFGLHFFVLVLTGFLALIYIFNDDISILVYEDRFTFRYSNYFGKLMAIDLVYYYKDVTNFKYSIDRWEPTIGQRIIIIFVATVLAGRQRTFTSKGPHAEIIIEYLSDLRQPIVKEIAFPFSNESHEIALKKIKDKLKLT